MFDVIRIAEYFQCLFIERVNRFVVKVRMDNEEFKAHINNTGRLDSLFVKGFTCFCTLINGRKLKYRLFAIESPNNRYFSIIDTSLRMKAFEKMIEKNLIDDIKGFDFKRNPRFGDSVFDYLLFNKKKQIIAEIKSAVMFGDGFSMYPDAPTKRGERHFEELIKLRKEGLKTMIFFVSSVPNVKGFKANKKVSSKIAELLIEAKRTGVVIKSFNILFSPEKSVIFSKTISFLFSINKNF